MADTKPEYHKLKEVIDGCHEDDFFMHQKVSGFLSGIHLGSSLGSLFRTKKHSVLKGYAYGDGIIVENISGVVTVLCSFGVQQFISKTNESKYISGDSITKKEMYRYFIIAVNIFHDRLMKIRMSDQEKQTIILEIVSKIETSIIRATERLIKEAHG